MYYRGKKTLKEGASVIVKKEKKAFLKEQTQNKTKYEALPFL